MDNAARAWPTFSPLNRHVQRHLAQSSSGQPTIRRAENEPRCRPLHLLATNTYELVTNQLENFGNSLSDAHRRSLMRLSSKYAEIILGKESGRWQYPLDTGCGKTESVIALCTSLNRLGMNYGVAIAASQVEALCEVKRRLVENGVPEERIGLAHSYKHSSDGASGHGYASLPSTPDNRERQFLLLTHNRIRGPKELEELSYYGPDKRRLLIWDESLLLAEAGTVDRVAFNAQLSAMLEHSKERRTNELSNTALSYLSKCRSLFDAEHTAQSEDGAAPKVLWMPSREAGQLSAYTQSLRQSGLACNQPVEALLALLKIAQARLRVVPEAKGQIHYDIVVPPELENIVVLDASWPLRLAVQAGEQFKEDEDFMRSAEGMKRYDNVVVHTLHHGSGRGKLESLFSGETAQDRLVSREVAELIKDEIPEGENVLIFTFKASLKGPDIPSLLEDDLKELGTDMSRIHISTWGRHDSTNEFSEVPNVILLGILHPPALTLAGQMIGQQNDLTAPLGKDRLEDAMQGEVAHYAYQALSRGTCRSVVDGQAKPMRAWLLHYNHQALDLMKDRMPGAKWVPWEAVHLRTLGEQKVERVARNIAHCLEGLGKDIHRASVKALKVTLGVDDLPSRSWTRAAAGAAEIVVGWKKQGRSFVRLSATDYGFVPETSS